MHDSCRGSSVTLARNGQSSIKKDTLLSVFFSVLFISLKLAQFLFCHVRYLGAALPNICPRGVVGKLLRVPFDLREFYKLWVQFSMHSPGTGA